MEQLPKRRIWLPSPTFLVLLGVAIVALALAIPGYLSSQRAHNERNASTSLKTLTSANADFRANDRDWNHVNDFWTGDVSGLYHVKPAPEGNPEIRLIEESVANADHESLFPRAGGPLPKAGYCYVALERDDNVEGKDRYYKAVTDDSGRKVHNLSKFGFLAFPASASEGKYVFFVNENNTIFREVGTIPKCSFPEDRQLMSYWSIVD
jgi:hypothetical protein